MKIYYIQLFLLQALIQFICGQLYFGYFFCILIQISEFFKYLSRVTISNYNHEVLLNLLS